MYDTEISHSTLSAITDKIIPEVKEDHRMVSRAVYNILGIDRHGHKELLGMYVSPSEGANFWLSVLTDLQNRGVKDYPDCLYR